jgi:two-component system, LytTR family, sensor histidine kinase AgrC
MIIIDIILKYVPDFIECFILWRLLSFVLDLKFRRRSAVAASIGMFIMIQVKDILSYIPVVDQYQVIVSFLILIYVFVVISLLTVNTFVEKLIWWGVYFLGLIAIELALILGYYAVIHVSLDTIIGTNEVNIIMVISTKLITLLLFEIVFRKHRGKINIGIFYLWELAMVIIFNLVLAMVLVYSFYNRKDLVEFNEIMALFFGVVLLITIYTVALIFRIEKKSNEETATQLRLQQIELELKLNNDMVDISDKLRQLRHDMNNHIGLIKTLVHTGKHEELEEYVDQIYEDVKIANDLIITNNKTLSILLNAKKNLAKEKNIDFSSVITILDLDMKSKDICSLLGNILDNAIEAAENSGSKKYIQLIIQKTERGYAIDCENSIGMKPVLKKGKFITSKEDTLLHGIGIRNIKDIVAVYHGELEFEYDDEAFNIHVLIPV